MKWRGCKGLLNCVFGSLRARYFCPRPLLESGDIESDSSTVVNLRACYRWERFSVYVGALNLLHSDDDDITYFYESRLPGESTGVEDIHHHVMEPRTVPAMSLALSVRPGPVSLRRSV